MSHDLQNTLTQLAMELIPQFETLCGDKLGDSNFKAMVNEGHESKFDMHY
jgi:hypothetical protein